MRLVFRHAHLTARIQLFVDAHAGRRPPWPRDTAFRCRTRRLPRTVGEEADAVPGLHALRTHRDSADAQEVACPVGGADAAGILQGRLHLLREAFPNLELRARPRQVEKGAVGLEGHARGREYGSSSGRSSRRNPPPRRSLHVIAVGALQGVEIGVQAHFVVPHLVPRAGSKGVVDIRRPGPSLATARTPPPGVRRSRERPRRRRRGRTLPSRSGACGRNRWR